MTRTHRASYQCEHTGHVINLDTFSRKHPPNAASTGTVFG